jgi:hypothetical protein
LSTQQLEEKGSYLSVLFLFIRTLGYSIARGQNGRHVRTLQAVKSFRTALDLVGRGNIPDKTRNQFFKQNAFTDSIRYYGDGGAIC